MTQNIDYVEACKVSEIDKGHMKHVEINGKEIAIANVDGKFYAFSDGCSPYECKTFTRKHSSGRS